MHCGNLEVRGSASWHAAGCQLPVSGEVDIRSSSTSLVTFHSLLPPQPPQHLFTIFLFDEVTKSLCISDYTLLESECGFSRELGRFIF